jgi:hypothetical protein
MFFHFHVPPGAAGQTPPPEENVELNINGEPKYLYGPDGVLIINDPTLVKEIPDVPEQPTATSEEPSGTVQE